MKSLILYTLLLSSSLAFAQLEAPQDLLKRAEKDAYELHLAMLDLQDGLSSLSTKDDFRNYFAILPDLAALGQKLDLESIHPGAMQSLGEQMVDYGMRWLDISKDDADTLQSYLTWMSATSAANYVSNVNLLLFHSKDYDPKFVSNNLDLLIALSSTKFKDKLYIGQGYRELNSEIAYRQLKATPVDATQETQYWVSKLSDQDTLSGYIAILMERTYLINVTERSQLSDVLELLKVLKATLDAGQIPTSVRIYDSLGDVLVELLDKATLFSWPLDTTQIASLMPVLNVTQTSNLGERIALSMFKALPEMDDQNALISESIISQLSQQGATQKAQAFADVYYSNAPFEIRNTQANEGIYVARDDKNRVVWTAHFFRSNINSFILSLTQRKTRSQIRNFFAMSYEYETDSFVFSQTSKNPGEDSGQFVRAQFDPSGSLRLEIPDRAKGWISVVAKRESAPPSGGTVSIDDGTMRIAKFLTGKLTLPGGQTQEVALSIVETNDTYLAQVSIGPRYNSSFDGFFNWADGSLYLTSQQNPDGRIVRIKINQDRSGTWTGTVLQTNSSEIGSIQLKAAENI